MGRSTAKAKKAVLKAKDKTKPTSDQHDNANLNAVDQGLNRKRRTKSTETDPKPSKVAKKSPRRVQTRSKSVKVNVVNSIDSSLSDDNYVDLDVMDPNGDFPSDEEAGPSAADAKQSHNNNSNIKKAPTRKSRGKSRSRSLSQGIEGSQDSRHSKEHSLDRTRSMSRETYSEHSSSDSDSGSESGEVTLEEEGDTRSMAASPRRVRADDVPPSRAAERSNQDLRDSFSLMQDFMVHKGIIDRSMTEADLEEFLSGVKASTQHQPTQLAPKGKEHEPHKGRNGGTKKGNDCNQSRHLDCGEYASSLTTIYKDAVQRGKPCSTEINELQQGLEHLRKISSSSDELIDTSDEAINILDSRGGTLRPEGDNPEPGTSASGQPADRDRNSVGREKADELIRQVELAKATMYQLKGREGVSVNQITAALMDEDYCVVASHLEDSMIKRIQSFEYVDFSKLLPRDRLAREGDNNLVEIVNKDGHTYLAPSTADKNHTAITSFGKWEQAFRVYSDVLTRRYPFKAGELIQYNHLIHTATQSYYWDNVYQYDRDFRTHISRHPTRSWSVILQQAWTIRLKDRIRNDNNNNRQGQGHSGRKSGGKEICKRFNRGKCTFGLTCRYDHHCSVPKCGKFGHGAHICRLCNSQEATNSGQRNPDAESARNDKTH